MTTKCSKVDNCPVRNSILKGTNEELCVHYSEDMLIYTQTVHGLIRGTFLLLYVMHIYKTTFTGQTSIFVQLKLVGNSHTPTLKFSQEWN